MESRKSELKKAFESVESLQELLKLFQQMESCFHESELGVECFLVAHGLYREKHREKQDLNQVLSFASRALTILTPNKSIWHISLTLHLLASVYCDLEMYELSLSYLNQADDNLTQLLDNNQDNSTFMDTLVKVHTDLYNVNASMGRTEEAVVHSIKVLEITEKLLEEGCVELGRANRHVYEAYCVADDHPRGLPFCLKALEIYGKCLGTESLEVAVTTRHLSLIYSTMGEHDKAFECNQLAQRIFRKTDPDSPDLVKARIESSTMLVELGRYQEAINVLKGVVLSSDMHELERLKLLVDTGRALCHLDKFDEARMSLRAAQEMLQQEGIDPMMVVAGYVDMFDMYEMMKDFETALSLIKGALAVSKVPPKRILELSDRLFSLISKSGKEKEELPYMEGVVERLKEYFGPKHYHVGNCYAMLGLCYGGSGQLELAAKYMAIAKDVLDASLGPHHLSSLKVGHSLCVAYANLGRFREALEIEEMVVEGLKGLEVSELGFMHEVNKLRSAMEEIVAAESPTMASPPSKDDEGLSTKISKCIISDDGKVLK